MDKDIIRLMESLSKKLEEKTSAFLSEEEELAVLAGLQEFRGEEFTDDEAKAVLKWAYSARLDESLLDLVIKGLVAVGIENGQPIFKITEKGTRHFNDNTDKHN